MSENLENEAEDLPEQIAIRLAKRDKLQETGSAYPVSLPITHTIGEVRNKFPNLEIDVSTGEKVAVSGRVVFARNTGKLCFATLQAGSWLKTGRWLQKQLDLFQTCITNFLKSSVFVIGTSI